MGVQLHRYWHWSLSMIGEEYGTWLKILRMPYLIIIFCTKLLFWDSLPLPCNGVGHHTLEVRCLNWAYFSWESHYINFSLLLRYELLTPGVIPKGFMDGRKACQKMVCRFAGFTLFIKLPYFLVQFIQHLSALLFAVIGREDPCHLFSQSISKLKPIATCHAISPALEWIVTSFFPALMATRYFIFPALKATCHSIFPVLKVTRHSIFPALKVACHSIFPALKVIRRSIFPGL